MPTVTVDDFDAIEMRIGRVLEAEDFPEARNPSYKLTIDFGPFGVKRSSAAIRPWYRKEDLLGRHVVAVTNFPPRRIASFASEVLCLGAVQADGRVILLRPDEEGELGARVA
ncbi:MAG: tRNA-binding protein [Euryarchaeota archaeon RBG_16_67_27]|nr:MAG: tRNA-binding protein [Euryarchaeota archaeon RBG_16_67_27]